MSTTSDERRDVARKIREYVDAYGDKIEDAEMVLLGTVCRRGEVGEVVRPTSEVELLAMVADLVDPTCHVVLKHLVFDDYRRNTLVLPVCSACGFTFDKRMPKPNFCPECGARLVSNDDQ